MLISLCVGIISQCMHIANHQVVYLTYAYNFCSYASIKLKKKKLLWLLHGEWMGARASPVARKKPIRGCCGI